MKEHSFITPLSKAILEAYDTGQEDELLEPHVLADEQGNPVGRIREGDSVIFYDIRGEREVELTEALTDPGFNHFKAVNLNLTFATMIRYHSGLRVREAFAPLERLRNTLGEVLSNAGKRVLKITEAEKAIHVSYFLNGKREEPYPGEERITVATRKDIATFDEAPQMSAKEVADETCKALGDSTADVVIVNLCNVDVVGHFENKSAVLKAVETVDECLGMMLECARKNNVTAMVTADHGTVEHWLYPEGAVDTGHTRSPVPFIIDAPGNYTLEKGELCDVAPTILSVLALKKPAEMSGNSLIRGEIPFSKRLMLIILDGWGYSEDSYGNMILAADTPNFDNLWNSRPHMTLAAAGLSVGLPEKSVGNSEVGHLHIGSGSRVPSDRVRIDQAIADGSFMENEVFNWAIDEAKTRGKAIHLLGIVSFYSSHGSVEHLRALLRLCKIRNADNVFVHAMLGRRGERPQAGARYVGMIEEECEAIQLGRVAGVIGRYWSLDREENWNRIEKTWKWLVEGEGSKVSTIS